MRTICEAYIPFKSGFMFANVLRMEETDTRRSAIYDGNIVPYLFPQENGFKHYLSGKMITKNKGFIKDKTTSALDMFYNNKERQGVLLSLSEKTSQSRQSQMSQGLLQQYQGNRR
jgi:hypothetical protein